MVLSVTTEFKTIPIPRYNVNRQFTEKILDWGRLSFVLPTDLPREQLIAFSFCNPDFFNKF